MFRNERRPSILTEGSFTNIFRYTPSVVELDVSWYELESPYSQSVETLALANLESLTVAVSDAFFPLETARRFSFPSLRKASIRSRSSDDDGAAVDDSRAQAATAVIRSGLYTVRELELDFGRDLSPAIVEGLELCDHVECLTLQAYPGVGVMKGLSIPCADETWLSPQLQTTVLHIHPDTLGDETVGLGKAVIDLVAARCAGLPESGLTRAVIHPSELKANLDMLTDLQVRVVRISL
ncbi:hypothetical protein EXIGLDRAFT_839951 [Exidia glandulosa HHB12029]|uniref:Uncharacterized protein n=1 Tax=Exidia glandulosa HHB12029 TaxID=1314781 RepID=A0A165EQH3_EXIGL|nr:hypothetical protein EXIGLDRAFT_839951 [Exidia glandulosa HHB12029]